MSFFASSCSVYGFEVEHSHFKKLLGGIVMLARALLPTNTEKFCVLGPAEMKKDRTYTG